VESRLKQSDMNNLGWLDEAIRHYQGLDVRAGNLITNLATLNRFADFDRLRRDYPADAEQLGIR
jgi:hypothetical protein